MRAPVALLAGLWFVAASASAAELVLPPEAKVEGRSQAEWSQLWWQWAFSFERPESPVADLTGERCHLRQEGPVWFLAGTYGTRRTIRTCRMPRGKFLFFPLINYVVMPTRDGTTTCDSVRNSARRMTDLPESLVLDIDGQRIQQLERYRQATDECFNVMGRRDGAPPAYPSAANGYYVMLSPLPPGKHEINFGGILPGMAQAVTYTLTVE